MKINDEYAPFSWTKEERKEFEKLNAKLERFARRAFYTHWFRGEIAGITPSGDDYTDFVVRAYIDCYPANGKFKIEQEKDSYKFQVGDFEELLEKILPLLAKLGQSADTFKDIQVAVEWLNKSIKPFQKYTEHIKTKKVDRSIGNLLPQNFGTLSEDELGKLAITVEGQKLKRVILTKLYPQGTPKRLKDKLYNRIKSEISRESRKKINNAVRNEAYYKENYTEEFDIFGSIPDEELSVRDQLIEEERNRVKRELVGEFCQYLKDEKYKMIISLFNAEKISLERLLTKVTDYPIVLINELVNHQLIFDASGMTTEKFARIDRPCKMKLNLPLKDKRSNSHLFGILKMDRSINKPRYIAYYLGMTEKDYYVYIRKLREQFIVFFNIWKNQGDNAEILGELELFQNIKE